MAAILSDKITVTSLDGMEEVRKYDTRLKTLMICVEGTIPGNRNFGLAGDFLDAPMYAASTEYAQELQAKVSEYIPEIGIESVDIRYDLDGKLETTVNIERNTEQ